MKREKAKKFQDLIVSQKAHPSEKISKLLEAYSKAIPASGYWLLDSSLCAFAPA